MLGFNFDNILIADVGGGDEKYEGKTVHQIAREEGMSDIDAYLHLCEISNNTGRVIMEPYSTAEIISEFFQTSKRTLHDRCLGRGAGRAEPGDLRLLPEIPPPVAQRQRRHHACHHPQDERRCG